MNILFLSGFSINPNDGGVARITHTLANLFAESGHNVWYLGYRKISEDDNTRQLYFPIDTREETLANQKYLESIIDSKSIDIAIVQNNPCKGYLKMLNECKKKYDFFIVSCFHNLFLTPITNIAYSLENGLKKKKLGFVFSLLKNKCIKQLLVFLYIHKNRKLHKFIVDNSDVTVVLGEDHKKELLAVLGREIDDNIQIIPNCCGEINTGENTKLNEVLWVGSVECKIKRIDYMIDIWKHIIINHPDWTLLVLGDGPSLLEMKSKVESSHINNIKFEGRVTPRQYYERAKIICVTSVHESFSLVTIEAKTHGVVPIVQNSFPLAKEIVNDGVDGVLVEPFSINDYCEKLDFLMSNNAILKEYSEKSILDSKKYSPSCIKALWNSLFAKYSLEGHVNLE